MRSQKMLDQIFDDNKILFIVIGDAEHIVGSGQHKVLLIGWGLHCA